VQVKIKKLLPEARIPEYTREGDAAMDIRAIKDYKLWPKETKMIETGLAVEVPKDFVMHVYSRSGLAYKGIFLGNAVGVIDSNYRGEICVILHNSTDRPFEISMHDRVAQICIDRVVDFNFVETGELSDTNRGTAGFGSSGVS